MDKTQALRECEKMWRLLADSAYNELGFDKGDINGPWENYRCNCPCCEFVFPDDSLNYSDIGVSTAILGNTCRYCPMFNQWMYYRNIHNERDMKRGERFPCLFERSPYTRWSNVIEIETEKMIPYDLEFFCLLIAELAREALDKYLPKVSKGVA